MGFGDGVPGQGLRATAGDRMQIEVSNRLPVSTSVHWDGLAIPNNMDSVPGVTTPQLLPDTSYTYDFAIPDPGTHWFHPHTGLQLDTGLYAPFTVDDPDEPGAYDGEWIVVLDDWTDGMDRSPDQIFADLTAPDAATAMEGMGMDGMGMDGGDVLYPVYLINGHSPSDPGLFTGKAGDLVRVRVINPAADSIFTLALSGHEVQVTHADGYPVTPRRATSLHIAMGERYDLLVTLGDGAFALIAQPLGKAGYARAVVRIGAGTAPQTTGIGDLAGEPVTVMDLSGTAATALPSADPDSIQDLVLDGSMAPYRWTINGATYPDISPLTICASQSGRLRLRNMPMMSHPMHLHGHTFQLGAAGGRGPRKDTVLVPPMGAVDIAFVADNPGLWMVHCRNAHHAEAGMMTRLDYVT